MYIGLKTKDSKWAGLGLSFLLLLVSNGCERDMSIKIDGKNPPTFTLSGSGNLIFLVLGEVHDNKLGAPEIWKIRPEAENKISELPSITYGFVPNGFIQVIPASGTPPPLIEGKLYEFGGPAFNANGGFVWFTIQGGKSVQVPMPGGS